MPDFKEGDAVTVRATSINVYEPSAQSPNQRVGLQFGEDPYPGGAYVDIAGLPDGTDLAPEAVVTLTGKIVAINAETARVQIDTAGEPCFDVPVSALSAAPAPPPSDPAPKQQDAPPREAPPVQIDGAASVIAKITPISAAAGAENSAESGAAQ